MGLLMMVQVKARVDLPRIVKWHFLTFFVSIDLFTWWRQGPKAYEKMIVDVEGTDLPGKEWLDGRLEIGRAHV